MLIKYYVTFLKNKGVYIMAAVLGPSSLTYKEKFEYNLSRPVISAGSDVLANILSFVGESGAPLVSRTFASDFDRSVIDLWKKAVKDASPLLKEKMMKIQTPLIAEGIVTAAVAKRAFQNLNQCFVDVLGKEKTSVLKDGVKIPFYSLERFEALLETVHAKEDASLIKIYAFVRDKITGPEDILGNANAIRDWLKDHPLNCKDLISLSMHDKVLEVIPKEIALFTELTQLCFYNCQVRYLPDDFYKLKKLEVLDLSVNNISKLSNKINNFKRLQSLWLHSGKLEELPPTIVDLTALRVMVLGANRITSLPLGFAFLTAIEEFYIDHNPIRTFPVSICSLPRLKQISIAGTEISALPEALFAIDSLKYLDVEGLGGLESLPKEALFSSPLHLKVKIEADRIDALVGLSFWQKWKLKNLRKPKPLIVG
jgi:hypothetical protein